MPTVSVIGSGNVGANAAFFISEKGVSGVGLYDSRDGIARGKALDMMEAAPIRGYLHAIEGLDALDDIAGSRVVVMAAGAVREPGMDREQLLRANRPIAEELGRRVAELAPDAVVVITTEPVDHITEVFLAASGLPRERVMGVGGLLDATRFRFLVARELGVAAENVSSLVIGRHNDQMLILDRYTRVSGIPLGQLLGRDRIDALKQETREAGHLVLELAQRSSAYYAPSAAVAELVAAIIHDLHRILPVSIRLAGEYGLDGVALSMPAIIGAGGVGKVLSPRLTADESCLLMGSVADCQTTSSNQASSSDQEGSPNEARS